MSTVSGDAITRLANADPLVAYEEGIRFGWSLALAWAGLAPSPFFGDDAIANQPKRSIRELRDQEDQS